jgi:hypothetical protein
MITQINDASINTVAFKASGQIDAVDFERVVVPAVKELVVRTGEINCLLYLDANMGHFSAGDWLENTLAECETSAKWNRIAIVTDSTNVINFTQGLSYIIPGEFQIFERESYGKALLWVTHNQQFKNITSSNIF